MPQNFTKLYEMRFMLCKIHKKKTFWSDIRNEIWSISNEIQAKANAEIGWRPTPEKNIVTMPCWGKNSPENCLVDLERDTRSRTQSRRLVRRKGASWSLNWPSGANLLAHLLLKCIPYVPL